MDYSISITAAAYFVKEKEWNHFIRDVKNVLWLFNIVWRKNWPRINLRCFYAEDLTFVCCDLSNFQVNQTLARSPAQPRATCGETFNDHQTSQDQDQEAHHHHRQLTRPQLRVWSVFWFSHLLPVFTSEQKTRIAEDGRQERCCAGGGWQAWTTPAPDLTFTASFDTVEARYGLELVSKLVIFMFHTL